MLMTCLYIRKKVQSPKLILKVWIGKSIETEDGLWLELGLEGIPQAV